MTTGELRSRAASQPPGSGMRRAATSREATIGNAAAAAGFVIMWSSGFIGARLATETASTITVLAWRFFAATALLLIGRVIRRALHASARRPLSRRAIGAQAVVGVLAQGVYLLAAFGAVELGVAPGTAALIAALQPITAGALAGPVLGERVDAGQWLGFGIGLAGVALVVSGDLGAGQPAPPWAYALPFLAMAGLVAATLLERRARLSIPLGDAMMIQCTATAALFGPLALVTGNLTPPAHDGNFWAAVAWVVVLSTFGGYGFYWLTLSRTSVTRVSSLIYLTPPTTMVWAFLMFGETPGLRATVGLLVCLIAVLIVHRHGPDHGDHPRHRRLGGLRGPGGRRRLRARVRGPGRPPVRR